jgi:hypothetical protein
MHNYVKYASYIKENLFIENNEKEVLHFLNDQGLSRKDIYDLLRFINVNDQISEKEEAFIGEILESLSGFTSFRNWIHYIRFKDEPKNDNEFMSYIGKIPFFYEI